MKSLTPINHIFYEDALHEAVIKNILSNSSVNYIYKPDKLNNCHGKSNIFKNMEKYNQVAKFQTILVLVDLNQKHKCPSDLLKKWFVHPKNHNLIFRIAVREVESWILADRDNFAKFIKIDKVFIPYESDKIDDPKECLIKLVKNSKIKKLRDYIVPKHKTTAKQGPNYNEPLVDFVLNHWDIEEAAKNSPSLHRTINAINNFKPEKYGEYK